MIIMAAVPAFLVPPGPGGDDDEDDVYDEVSDAELEERGWTAAIASMPAIDEAVLAAYRADGLTDDIVHDWLHKILNIPLLSVQQETSLALRAQAGDAAAAEHLLLANTRYVVTIANGFRNQGVPFADLVSEGNIGLRRAVQKFDPSKKYRFTTYATAWIKQAMRRAVENEGCNVRIPAWLHGKLARLRALIKSGEVAQMADAEVAQMLGISLEHLSWILPYVDDPVRLNRRVPTHHGNDTQEILDVLPDQVLRVPDLAEALVSDEASAREIICELLSPANSHLVKLSARERQVLCLRYGIDWSDPEVAPTEQARIRRAAIAAAAHRQDVTREHSGRNQHDGLTLLEAAEVLRVSRERVRQNEAEGLRKLRTLAGVLGYHRDGNDRWVRV